MSKVATRFAIEDARLIAQSAAQHLAGLTVRVQIAGSIRRDRPAVGDIDLVAELDPGNPWALAGLEGALDAIEYRCVRGGERIRHYARAGSPGIDLYLATAKTWGITLLVRTGSAAHNVRLAEAGKHRLPSRKLAVSRGIVDTADRVVASRTEEECFAALGLAYVDPEDREAPEYEALVRAE